MGLFNRKKQKQDTYAVFPQFTEYDLGIGPQGRRVRAQSLLSPEDVKRLGMIPTHAIFGTMEGEDFTLDTFTPNPIFIRFMHQVIEASGMSDPDLIEAAAGATEDTFAYVIDLRTPRGPDRHVPAEDIIGCFAVKDGKLVKDSYKPFKAHKLLTSKGIFKLPPRMEATLLMLLKRNIYREDTYAPLDSEP